MACGGPNSAPCGGPVPRAAADCGCTPAGQGACESSTWTIGPWRYTQSAAGCITRAPVGTAITDGVYTNPQITMAGGHIIAIRNGTNVVATLPSLCAPNSLGSTPVAGSTVLDPAACNLTVLTNGRLVTRLYVAAPEPESPLAVTGCGTANDPLRFTLTLPEASVGVDFTGPGITIVDGLVTDFALPVLNVTADPATGLQSAWNPTTATITLSPISGSATARLPAVVCDDTVTPTNGILVGTPSTTYALRLPNTSSVVYTVTTSSTGAATVNGMVTGVYEVYVGTTSLGYIAYTRCAPATP